MMRTYIFILCYSFLSLHVIGQNEGKLVREGNREYKKDEFGMAEKSYRRALEESSDSYKAIYNLGNSLYKQEKYNEALAEYDMIKHYDKNKKDLAKVYHNLGNTYLQNKKYGESVNAYKQALKYNPRDNDTKYNLAYAQRLLRQQQQQQQQQNQENKDNQQEKEQQENQDENKDQNQQQDQQQENQITKEDAERMLEALEMDERELQEKLKKQKARSNRVQIEKDW